LTTNTGIDMTDEQLDVARVHVPEFASRLGWQPNLEFRNGYIERIQGILTIAHP
jgi:hypothetical protein